jgi:hypothetical protein
MFAIDDDRNVAASELVAIVAGCLHLDPFVDEPRAVAGLVEQPADAKGRTPATRRRATKSAGAPILGPDSGAA